MKPNPSDSGDNERLRNDPPTTETLLEATASGAAKGAAGIALVIVIALAVAATVANAAPVAAPDYDATRAALAFHRDDALARWEALHASMRRSGADCALMPAAALAYERAGRPEDAYRTLETLRSWIVRDHGYLARHQPLAEVVAALRASVPADHDCREMHAACLRLAVAKLGTLSP